MPLPHVCGDRCAKKNASFLHGSSIFDFLVLCCMQPLGCVIRKKQCKYREKNVEAFFQPQRESNVIKIHLGCILGLSSVISGSSWGGLVGNLRFCRAYIGPLRAYVRPYNILGQLEGYMLGLSWPKWPYWVISRLCRAHRRIEPLGGLC